MGDKLRELRRLPHCEAALRAGLHGHAISCGLCVPTEGGCGGDSYGFAAMALQGER